MKNITFTPSTITIDGIEYPATYTIAADETISVSVTVAAGDLRQKYRITIHPDDLHHPAAMAAALGAGLVPKEATPAQVNQSRKNVPEKLFAGTAIKGNGWRILFDTTYDRTRVIFDRVPAPAVREMVKTAGFFWSPQLKSWNKKLTHKAFRVAQDLARQLQAVRI
ncbi:MAG: hypothetical protein J6K72_08305 [Clostridia bacterium]|nr:hypothetical protein [Clostridia bacterium]